MLRYGRIQNVFFADTMFATPKAKSTRGSTCCQVFFNDKGFVAVYPMKTQTEFETALYWFYKYVGIPISLVMDAHKAQRKNDVKRFCDQVGSTLRVLEKGTPWANCADCVMGFSRKLYGKICMHQMHLWCSGIMRWNAEPSSIMQYHVYCFNAMTSHLM